jgi:hypothetical protein
MEYDLETLCDMRDAAQAQFNMPMTIKEMNDLSIEMMELEKKIEEIKLARRN